MNNLDGLTDKLADLVNEFDETSKPKLSDTLNAARAYLAPHIFGVNTDDEQISIALDDIVLGVAADLWQARDARNGVMSMLTDGIEPYRISDDPLRSAWPKLRALGITAGMGIA